MPLKFHKKFGKTVSITTGRKPLSQPQKQAVRKIAKKEILKNQENKLHVVGVTGGVNNAGTITDLGAIAQGLLDTNRIGDSILMGSMSFRGRVVFADQYNATRMILFQWFEDTTPIPSDLLLATASWKSAYNSDNHQKYKILYDRTYFTDNVNRLQVPIRGRVKMSRKKLAYLASTTGGTSKPYVLFISDSGGVPDPNPSVDFRLNYRDA